MQRPLRCHGFTLIEVLVTLLLLAVLALLSYRSLAVVLSAREQVNAETAKWQQLAAFMTRFKQDVQLAAPYPARSNNTLLPAWLGSSITNDNEPLLEFSRFASVPGQDRLRRVAYTHNDKGELELWLWPALDMAAASEPARYVVLSGVDSVLIEYLDAELQWQPVWPLSPQAAAIPRAVRLQLQLASGEVLVRIFALGT